MPACNPVTRKNPFASVNATWCCPALPATSTVAPICATPAESRTYPDSDEGDTPADAATHSEITTAKPASIRVIVRPPTEVSGTETLRPKPASAGRELYNHYSTANLTEGAICCFDTLSATLIVNLYMPG